MDTPLVQQDIQILLDFYSSKLYTSIKTESYFILARIVNQLQQLKQEIINYLPELQAPFCQQLHAAVQMENYCIVCQKFIDPHAKQALVSKIQCPSCQVVVFCSGYCSLEHSSHPCQLLTRIKMKKQFYDPEIQSISFNRDTNLMTETEVVRNNNIQQLQQLEQDTNDMIQVANSSTVIQLPVKLKQVFNDQELQQSADNMLQNGTKYMELQIKPIYQSVLSGQKQLYGDNQSQEIKDVQKQLYQPSIDPFLYQYFIRICQILSDGVRKIKQNNSQIEKKIIDLHTKVGQLDEFEKRIDDGFQEFIYILKQSEYVHTLSETRLMMDKCMAVYQRLFNIVDQKLPEELKDLLNELFRRVSIQTGNKVLQYFHKLLDQQFKAAKRLSKVAETSAQMEEQLRKLKSEEISIDQKLIAANENAKVVTNIMEKFSAADPRRTFTADCWEDAQRMIQAFCKKSGKMQKERQIVESQLRNRNRAQANAASQITVDQIIDEAENFEGEKEEPINPNFEGSIIPMTSQNFDTSSKVGRVEEVAPLSANSSGVQRKDETRSKSNLSSQLQQQRKHQKFQHSAGKQPPAPLVLTKQNLNDNQILTTINKNGSKQMTIDQQLQQYELIQQQQFKEISDALADEKRKQQQQQVKYITYKQGVGSSSKFHSKSFTRKVVFHRDLYNLDEEQVNSQFLIMQRQQDSDFSVKKKDWKLLTNEQASQSIFTRCQSAHSRVAQSKNDAGNYLTVINYEKLQEQQRTNSCQFTKSSRQQLIQVDSLKMRGSYRIFIHQLSKQQMGGLARRWLLFYYVLSGLGELREGLGTVDFQRFQVKAENIRSNCRRLLIAQRYRQFCIEKDLFKRFNYLALNQNLVGVSFYGADVGFTPVQVLRVKEIYAAHLKLFSMIDHRLLASIYQQIDGYVRAGRRLTSIGGISLDVNDYAESTNQKLFKVKDFV